MRYKIIIPELGFTDKKPFDTSDDLNYLINRVKKLRKTMNTNIYILDVIAKVMGGYVYVIISKDYIKKINKRKLLMYDAFI